MATYAVFDKFTGEYLANVTSIDTIDPIYYTYKLVPDVSGGATTPDEEVRYDTGSGEFVFDTTVLEAILKAQIDQLREDLQVPAVTEGFGKAQEYSGKAGEILLFDIMDPAQFASLTNDELYDKFTFAYEDASYFGGTIIEAIERFREGARSSRYLLAKQAALAQVAKTLVAIETTVENKRNVIINYGEITGATPEGGSTPPDNSDLYLTTESGVSLTTEQDIAILV